MSKEKNYQKYFGVSLDELVKREGSVVPILLQRLACYLLEYGVDIEGIFRVNGSSKNIEKLKTQFDKKGEADLESFNDPHSVASLLKLFLRELPDTLVPASMTQLFVAVQQASVKDSKLKLSSSIRTLIQSLPLSNRRTLKYLTAFLVLASYHSNNSKMNPSAISTVFGPNVFKCGAGFSGLKEQGETNCLMLLMMNKYDEIFLSSAFSPHHPLFTLEYLIKEELSGDGTKNTNKKSYKTFSVGDYGSEMMDGGRDKKGDERMMDGENCNQSNSFLSDTSSTPIKNRELQETEPLFSEIVQLHIDKIVSKYLNHKTHNNENNDDLIDDPESFFTLSKVIPSKSPIITKNKSLSSNCINKNNDNTNNNTNNYTNNYNNDKNLRMATSFENIRSIVNRNNTLHDDKVVFSEEDNEDGGADDDVRLDAISSSDNDDDEKDYDDDIRKHFKESPPKTSKKTSDKKYKRDSSSEGSIESYNVTKRSNKDQTTDHNTHHTNNILKAKALNRSIQVNHQKLHKLENNYEEERGKKLRHDDVKTIRKDIQHAKMQLQDLGKDYDKGLTLEQPISIQETYNILMTRLQHKRLVAGRSEDPMKMTPAEISEEKISLQKVLLQMEGLHGRPNTAVSKGVVLPLYERYRLIKRLLSSKSSLSNTDADHSLDSNKSTRKSHSKSDIFSDTIHSHKHRNHSKNSSNNSSNNNNFNDASDVNDYNKLSLSSLLLELEEAKGRKKELQFQLQLFEQSFLNKYGRKIQKADQMLKERDYHRYKNVKSKIKLLEVLAAKKQQTNR